MPSQVLVNQRQHDHVSSDAAMRTLILSDLHMGRDSGAVTSVEALRTMIAPFDRLVLNGDTAEVHHPRHRVRAARMSIELLDQCEEDAVDVTILSGNHDPMVSDVRHLRLCGGEVFVTHGDAFHPAVAPWSPRARTLRRAHDRAMNMLEGSPVSALEARLAASQHAARHEWDDLEFENPGSSVAGMLARPWAFMQVLWYWHRFPRYAATFASDLQIRAKFLIFGHTHRQGLWRLDDRVIINTGSYGFPGKPWAVVLEGHSISVHQVTLADGVYELADRPVAAFDLRHAAT